MSDFFTGPMTGGEQAPTPDGLEIDRLKAELIALHSQPHGHHPGCCRAGSSRASLRWVCVSACAEAKLAVIASERDRLKGQLHTAVLERADRDFEIERQKDFTKLARLSEAASVERLSRLLAKAKEEERERCAELCVLAANNSAIGDNDWRNACQTIEDLILGRVARD